MKKLLIGAIAFAIVGSVMATSTPGGEELSNIHETSIPNAEGSRYTILNDTDEKIRIHTGYGETTLNPRGGRTSVNCEPGKKVKVNGDVIFEVEDEMCGETVKLSDYL